MAERKRTSQLAEESREVSKMPPKKKTNSKAVNLKKGSTSKMAKGFGISEISSLLKLLKENDVTNFKLERDGEKISLHRGAKSVAQVISAPSQIVSQGTEAPSFSAPVPIAAQAEPKLVSEPKTTSPQKELLEIKSPMVGTFYTKSSPDAEPFVKVGDTISKGTVVCIIEAMKIMNEIESDFSGKIVEICVEDGQMAEYEETLFKVEP